MTNNLVSKKLIIQFITSIKQLKTKDMFIDLGKAFDTSCTHKTYQKVHSRSSNHRLQIPKFNLGISGKKIIISVTKLWNTIISKLLDCPTLSVRPFTKGCQFIISGSTKNSDLLSQLDYSKKDLKIY